MEVDFRYLIETSYDLKDEEDTVTKSLPDSTLPGTVSATEMPHTLCPFLYDWTASTARWQFSHEPRW